MSQRGYISKECARVLSWTVLFLLVLFVVLKDVPW